LNGLLMDPGKDAYFHHRILGMKMELKLLSR
jgi:hypothetical protein